VNRVGCSDADRNSDLYARTRPGGSSVVMGSV